MIVAAEAGRDAPMSRPPMSEMSAQSGPSPIAKAACRPVMPIVTALSGKVVVMLAMRGATSGKMPRKMSGKVAAVKAAESTRSGIDLRQGKAEKNCGADGQGCSQKHIQRSYNTKISRHYRRSDGRIRPLQRSNGRNS
jgi:hypothetical protein